jgi:aspartokinase
MVAAAVGVVQAAVAEGTKVVVVVALATSEAGNLSTPCLLQKVQEYDRSKAKVVLW